MLERDGRCQPVVSMLAERESSQPFCRTREVATHLFGDRNEPHLTHFIADRQGGAVVLAWDVRNAAALSWRVLRSEHDFAAAADAPAGSDQTLVSEGAQCGARDEKIDELTTYYYTVFARDTQGVWHRQVKVKVKPDERLRWRHPAYGEDVASDYVDCGELEREPDLIALRTQSSLPYPPPLYR
jgi:hypothetical protein